MQRLDAHEPKQYTDQCSKAHPTATEARPLQATSYYCFQGTALIARPDPEGQELLPICCSSNTGLWTIRSRPSKSLTTQRLLT